MSSARTLKSPSDRTLNRLIVGAILVIVIGIPVIAAIYFFDRHVDAGPSLVERQFSAAEEAVRKEPNKVSARLALRRHVHDGQAVRRCDRPVQRDPQGRADPPDGSSRPRLAELATGDLVAARADYEKMADAAKAGEMAGQDPQLEAAYYSLGDIALKQDRPKDAQTLLESAIKINRTDADALNLLGTAYIRNGDAKTAVEVLKAAVALVPAGWCEPYSQLGQAYTTLGKTDGAAYANGMVSLCEGRLDEAKTQLQPLAGRRLRRGGHARAGDGGRGPGRQRRGDGPLLEGPRQGSPEPDRARGLQPAGRGRRKPRAVVPGRVAVGTGEPLT